MQTTRKPKFLGKAAPLLVMATLAALGLAAAPAHAQTFTDVGYSASSLANDGTQNTTFDQLNLAAGSGNVALTPGTPTPVAINGLTFTVGPSSSSIYGPISYTGSELLTVGGQTKTLNFTYDVTSNYSPDVLHFSNSAPTVYDFGSQGKVTVNVIDQTFATTPGVTTGSFIADFTATPAPEPSSVAAFAFTGLGTLGLLLKARKRKSNAA